MTTQQTRHPVTGTYLDIATDDGVADAYFAHPTDVTSAPGVLFFMDAYGLRPVIEQMVERLAANGYAVLAPNVLYRSGRSPLFEDLEAKLQAEDRSAFYGEIMPMIQALTPDLAARDGQVWLRWLAERAEVADGPVGITGYCMGGRLAVRLAGEAPERVAAVGGFHTGNVVTDDADSPHLALATARAEFTFGHADNDQSMQPEQVAALDRAIADAGLTGTSEVYAGAAHGYTMADTPAWNEAAAERHWQALTALLDRAL